MKCSEDGHIVVLAGHRWRQYCNDACRMAARRARTSAENRAQDAALQFQLALHEREVWRKQFGGLLPTSLDLLRHLRITSSEALAEQIAAALWAEHDEGRKSLAEERVTLIDETMLTGEQLDFPAIATETFDLAPRVFCWSAFCGSASIEQLRQAHDTAHLKLRVKRGRLKLAELGGNRHASGG